jgi:cytochrome P450
MPAIDTEQNAKRFSILDKEMLDHRWVPVVNDLRNQCPIFHSEAHEEGFWVLTRYEDVLFAHRHPEMYSSYPAGLPRPGNIRPMIPLESDPPLHKKYRSPVNEYFSNRVQQSFADEYRTIASKVLDRFVDRGNAEFVEELCYPIPMNVIMKSFQVPEEDWGKVQRWVEHMLVVDELSVESITNVYTYFRELIEAHWDEPRDPSSLINILCTAEIDGERLTVEEILDYIQVLVSAGFETTASTMGYVLMVLNENPQVRQAVCEDPERIPAMVEEVLRLETPVRGLARTVVVEHELGGHVFRRGDRVQLLWAAANRDPDRFDSAEEFQLDRYPNRHLGFGAGVHLCLGVHMARVVLRVTLEELLRRIPHFVIDMDRVEEEARITWGYHKLFATWDDVL